MIHISILRHIRRLIASAMIFGTVVFLMLYIPIQILKKAWPTFLPYTLSGDSEVNEFSLQLLLLQVSFLNKNNIFWSSSVHLVREIFIKQDGLRQKCI